MSGSAGPFSQVQQVPANPGPANQWLRKVSLIVTSDTSGLDLSEFRITFKTAQTDTETPNNVRIRVYNLKPETVQSIQKEFTSVTLQAGYVNGAFGVIFNGTIVQTRKGKESNVDSYLDIFAVDGDLALNYTPVNISLKGPTSQQDIFKQATKAIQGFDPNIQLGQQDFPQTGGVLPRGKVSAGMARDMIRRIGQTTGTRISIQNGKLVVIPLTSYLSADPVDINSKTGLIGIPESTQEGVMVTCLLNPSLLIGQRIRINQADINTVNSKFGNPGAFGAFPSLAPAYYADVTADGIYKAFVIEHEGDSRGNPWYSHIIALSVDPSSSTAASVNPNSQTV